LLPSNAFRPKERRSNLSEDDAELPWEPNRMQHTSVYRRRGHHYKKIRVLDH
jgi:hypothetical protein